MDDITSVTARRLTNSELLARQRRLTKPDPRVPQAQAILGVDQFAGADEINTAFRLRARRDHPHCGGTEEQFRILQLARNILLFDRYRFHRHRPDSARPKTATTAEDMRAAIADSGSVALYGIQFDSGEEVVLPDSQAILEKIVKLMNMDPQLKLRIVGHTDDQGSAAHKLALSSRCAASVVRELTTRYGIAAGRLDSFGVGFYAPVAPNATREGRALNRRVELVRIGVWSC